MATKQDLDTAVASIRAKIEETNAKTDQLIVVAQACHDALVALRNAGGATAEELNTVVNDLNAGISSLTVQDSETDAAAGAVAP